MPNKTHLAAICALSFLCGGSASAQTAYVGSSSEYLISTVNETNGTLTKVALAGLYGYGLSVSADGTLAAVPVGSSAGIDLVNLKTGAITTPFTNIPGPAYPLISPDGSFVIMRSYSQAFDGLVVASTTTGAIVASLPLEGTIPLLVTPDSSGIYATLGTGLSLLGSKSLATKLVIPGVDATALAFSNDGTRLYAATAFSRASPTILSIIDTATNTVIAAVPGGSHSLGSILGLTLSPDNKTAYIAAQNALVEVSTVTASVTGYIPAPPSGLSGSVAASTDGTSVFACRRQGAVQGSTTVYPGLIRFDLAQGTTSVVTGSTDPIALFRPAPSQPIYLLNLPSETVVENPAESTVVSTIGTTAGVSALAVSTSGNRVAGVSPFTRMAGRDSSVVQVSVIDTASHQKVGGFLFPAVAVPNYYPAISIALSSDGSLGYMVEPTLINNGRVLQVSTLELPGGTVQSSFSVAAAASTLAIAPDGSRLYLDGICAVTLATQALQCTPPYNGNPKATASSGPAVVSPDGASIYDAFIVRGAEQQYLFTVVDEIDSATMTLRRELEIPISAVGDVGSCVAPAIDSDSLYLACNVGWVGQPFTGAILRVDLTDFRLSAAQFLNYIPQGIAATPDGAQVLVTGSTHGTQVFDGTTLAYTGSISGGIQSGIVIAPQ